MKFFFSKIVQEIRNESLQLFWEHDDCIKAYDAAMRKLLRNVDEDKQEIVEEYQTLLLEKQAEVDKKSAEVQNLKRQIARLESSLAERSMVEFDLASEEELSNAVDEVEDWEQVSYGTGKV